MTGAVVPTPAPVAPPVPPQPATPAPGAAAIPTGTGMAQAGAIPAGAAPGGTAVAHATDPAGDGDAETGDVGESGRTGTASKDFLTALSESGAAAGPMADPAAPPASGPAADAGAAIPSIPGQGLLAPAGGTTGAHAAPATNPAAPTPPAVPVGQVPMTIGLRSLAGSSEFQIRLDPAELGRIEVKLEIDRAKGTVSTHLTVDRPDTLALLQRDAGQLQQALTQAGLDPGAGA